MKANHNTVRVVIIPIRAVFNGSKILIWKQITTHILGFPIFVSCIQWFKDTNLKANHNRIFSLIKSTSAVFNGSKILIWKQITTCEGYSDELLCCIQWFKDTNLKANHNADYTMGYLPRAVFNGSKILIWKQITTYLMKISIFLSCIQWFKDTNLKANHNVLFLLLLIIELYSMVQRY